MRRPAAGTTGPEGATEPGEQRRSRRAQLTGWAWRRHGGLALAAQPPAGRLAAAGRGKMVHHGAEAERRHVVVDGFVLARLYQVALVPDAERAVVADHLVVAPPHRHVQFGLRAREALQVLERPPVLDHADAARVDDLLAAEEALLRVAAQVEQHADEGRRAEGPLAQREEPVDAHADDEHHERLIGVRRVAAREWLVGQRRHLQGMDHRGSVPDRSAYGPPGWQGFRSVPGRGPAPGFPQPPLPPGWSAAQWLSAARYVSRSTLVRAVPSRIPAAATAAATSGSSRRSNGRGTR